MSEEVIVNCCSPTLAGLKTGSLFSCSYKSRAELFASLRKYNLLLGCRGVRFFPLRLKNNKALIYVYRPSHLVCDLKNTETRCLLSELGYDADSCGSCLAVLMKRLCESEEFPHEIGLFLGYPCEDVRGFIENRAECAKCVGCWKVYGDVEKAKRQFQKYKKCTRVYQRQWSNGKPLTKLAVNSRGAR